MKLGAAAQGRVTPISGLRSFTEASVAVQTLGLAAPASFATGTASQQSGREVGVAFRVRVRIGSTA